MFTMTKTFIVIVLLQLITTVCNKSIMGIENFCNQSVLITSDNIGRLQECEIFQGTISITNDTFGNMYPAKLDALKSIRTINGGLVITAQHPLFTSLSFFENLEKIVTDDSINKMCTVIHSTSLKSIKLPALQEINCNVVIQHNEELCYADQWKDEGKLYKKYIYTSIKNNKNDNLCECHEQCEGKCWGPESHQCFDCKYQRIKGTRNGSSGFTCIKDCISDIDTCKALCSTSCEGPCVQKCYNEKIKEGNHSIQLEDLNKTSVSMIILIVITCLTPIITVALYIYHIRFRKKKIIYNLAEPGSRRNSRQYR